MRAPGGGGEPGIVGPPPRSRLRRFLPLLGLLLLAAVLSRLDGAAMCDALGRVTPATVAAAGLCFLLNVLVKALRWHRLLAAQQLPLPPTVMLATYLSGLFYGQVTVGRLGEFLRAEALTSRGVPVGRALSACFVDRVFDLAFVLCTAGSLGAVLLGRRHLGMVALVLLLGLLAGLGGLRALRLTGGWTRLRFGPLERLHRLAVDLGAGAAPLLRPRPLLEATVWTALGWLGHFAALWWLAAGLDIAATRLWLTTAACLGALSSLLPVTVSGLGAREVAYAEVLGPQGVSPELSVVLSLLHLSVMTFVAVAIGLPATLWRRRQQAAGR